ncbi:GyrI-like domain-containing protein [Spirosoma sp. KCTC 42546]|uniref:GyrI-like domain-containing protein n=1 Tax=Spirosoma sp. KCTC 42546 TaxID=2520506 RepID=UPI00115884B8|nr:GyrI-like domain-containing protein [Spirosoma sp. KCTC 42546]QDK83328.1 GyrI-like domain-containing protein [Spirosoma sp. KCTC 42546]
MTTQLTIPENALSEKETQPFTALTFTTRTTLQTLSQYAPSVAMELYKEASRLNLDIAGPIQWIYTDATGDVTKEFQLEIVLPIRQSGEQSAEFSYQEFPAFRCLSYTHTGPWSEFGELYDVLFGQFHRDGNQTDGRVREVYTVVDLEHMENCVTEIQIGLL